MSISFSKQKSSSYARNKFFVSNLINVKLILSLIKNCNSHLDKIFRNLKNNHTNSSERLYVKIPIRKSPFLSLSWGHGLTSGCMRAAEKIKFQGHTMLNT